MRPGTTKPSPDGDGDEAAADDARRRYRSTNMATLGPDVLIAPFLEPGERVLSVRDCAAFERRSATRSSVAAGRGGLYLTSMRLIVFSEPLTVVVLDEIEEADVSGDRLLLVLRDGAGLSLAVERPLLLRVEVAAARAAARSS